MLKMEIFWQEANMGKGQVPLGTDESKGLERFKTFQGQMPI